MTLIIVEIVILQFQHNKIMDISSVSMSLYFTLAGLIIHFTLVPQSIAKNTFFKPSVFALLGLVIVQAQIYLDLVLNIASQFNYYIWINPAIVNYSAYISSIAVNCFLLGNSINFREIQKVKIRKEIIGVNFLIPLSFIVLAAYFSFLNKAYLFGGYGTVNIGVEATYLALIFQILIYAYLIQNTINIYFQGGVKTLREYVIKMKVSFLMLIIIYLISVILSGDRGPIFLYSLPYLTGYIFLTKFKINFIKASLGLLFATFFFNFLGNIRSLDNSTSFQARAVESIVAADDKTETILGGTYELASSIRTLHYAVDYVNQTGETMNGRFLFQQVANTIPFFNYFYSVIFKDMSYKTKGSASFFTWLEQGDNPSSGVGSSVVADFYIDTGLIGVIIGMIFFGGLMRYLDILLYSRGMASLFTMCLLFVYISVALYISRSELLTHLKLTVWTFLLLIGIRIFTHKRI